MDDIEDLMRYDDILLDADDWHPAVAPRIPWLRED